MVMHSYWEHFCNRVEKFFEKDTYLQQKIIISRCHWITEVIEIYQCGLYLHYEDSGFYLTTD